MTSSAAAGVYLERHVANLRLGMTLELFTATGALVGGSIAFLLDERLLSLCSRCCCCTWRSRWRVPARRNRPGGPRRARPVADDAPVAARPVDTGRRSRRGRGGRRGPDGPRTPADARPATIVDGLSGEGYHVRNLGRGMVGATGAGVVSALLGIGGGIVKVPVMHLVDGRAAPGRDGHEQPDDRDHRGCRARSIYAIRGGIDPTSAGPTAVGVFVGATVGSRLGHRVDLRLLRLLFVVVLVYTAFQMLLRVFQ